MKVRPLLIVGLLAAGCLRAETGREGWLRYSPLDEAAARQDRAVLAAVVAAFGDSPVLESARAELLRGLREACWLAPCASSPACPARAPF